MTRDLKIVLSLVALAFAADGAPAHAQEASAAAQTVPAAAPQASTQEFQVARAGDTQLSCEALAAEITGIAAEMDAMQARTDQLIAGMRPRSRVMPGARAAAVATAVGGAAVPGAGLAIAAASHQAMMSARSARRGQQMEVLGQNAMAQAEVRSSLLSRVDHLSAISRAKAC